jgi:hypothetical protein
MKISDLDFVTAAHLQSRCEEIEKRLSVKLCNLCWIKTCHLSASRLHFEASASPFQRQAHRPYFRRATARKA